MDALDPDEVAAATFPVGIRGYDPEAVRTLLEQVAAALREFEALRMRSALAEAGTRLAELDVAIWAARAGSAPPAEREAALRTALVRARAAIEAVVVARSNPDRPWR